MRTTINGLVRWAPRVLGLAFAAFLSVFALEAFGEGRSPMQTALALAMHLIPSAVVLVALAIAWRWRWAGAIVFTALGAWYVASSWGRFPWSTYVVIAGPTFLMGLLFAIDGWSGGRRPRPGPSAPASPHGASSPGSAITGGPL